jgi:hypothetical protein
MRRFSGICFRCVCGERHSIPMKAPLGFLHPPTADISLAAFYSHPDHLPDDLNSFRGRPFWCPEKKEIVPLPKLDCFFFELMDGGPLLVAAG